jgi:Spy/CpxP family protein refolding chaperone
MKRIICAVIAAGLLLAGPLARNSRAEEGGKEGEKHGEHAEKMMKERLGLTDDQAAKLKAAFEAEKTAVKGLREQSKEAARKLEEEVRDLSSDKDIQATLDQLDANRKAVAAEHQKMESSVASILKPYQRAKMRLMMRERMMHQGRWERGEHKGREGRDGHMGREGGEHRWDHKDGGEGEHHDDD